MKIEILGGGCANCANLYKSAVSAVEQTGVAADVVKDENYETILKYGITSTPALVVDGVVKSSGKVLKADEVVALIT